MNRLLVVLVLVSGCVTDRGPALRTAIREHRVPAVSAPPVEPPPAPTQVHAPSDGSWSAARKASLITGSITLGVTWFLPAAVELYVEAVGAVVYGVAPPARELFMVIPVAGPVATYAAKVSLFDHGGVADAFVYSAVSLAQLVGIGLVAYGILAGGPTPARETTPRHSISVLPYGRPGGAGVIAGVTL